MSWTVGHRNILPVQLDNTKAKPTCISLTHFALINCRSIINKSANFQVELVHNKVDICYLTETWIREMIQQQCLKSVQQVIRPYQSQDQINREEELLWSIKIPS